ncbi:MAG: ATP phosphoribosyltransferase regulatory subunit [Gammaproteobacteria bacterium]|nr:ATP phosphoribosyltransferase regulatory subunit [Gammaproteobacteria bacterium]MDH5594335.1 ATP phosphoribosyltransferase regulatory subunit [Gammaproteobacteria bacterium]MDH5614800.1 ATP phosphoribosyltransferase regulatory subunit [Gammaproteobacteria bacterium]
MNMKNRWLLPEGIDELLPPQAEQVEAMRRNLLDMYKSWGYELIMPPFVEFLDSLLTGTGNDLDLQTFKLTDQVTGRTMGVRADMTPQAARIDAHSLKREGPVRLCYMGTVLRTRPETQGGTRSPLQIGAELYGHSGVESDIEILQLMLETLKVAGVNGAHVDLGHVGIFRGLARQAGLNEDQEAAMFDALQRKALPEINALLADFGVASKIQGMFKALVELNGDASVLQTARKLLKEGSGDVSNALDELIKIQERAQQAVPDTQLYFDLAELRGYNYHTGVVFAAYVQGLGQSVAQGGRYDEIGSVFGRARPATGFSVDLKSLITGSNEQSKNAVFAPAGDDAGLIDAINGLRAQGVIVIRELPGQNSDAQAMGCNRILFQCKNGWEVKNI